MRSHAVVLGLLLAGRAEAGTTYFPGEAEHAMLLFEDQWPCRGDLDLNDAVIRFNTLVETTPGGEDTRLTVNLTVHAIGASIASGGALLLPVPIGSIASATLQTGSLDGSSWGEAGPLDLEPSGTDTVLRFATNLRDTCDGAPGFLNTATGVEASCHPLVIEVSFQGGVSLPNAVPDVFLFRTDDPSHEIHQSPYAGSAAMNTALFDTCDDGSTVGRHFVDTAGLPFALLIGEGTLAGPGDPQADWPTERTRVDLAWPRITAFAASGGTTDQDFYADPGNDPAHAWGGSGHTVPALHHRYPYGRSSDRPGLTCADILDADPGPDGTYWLDLTGGLPIDAFQTWCDMAGGGRTLVAHRNVGSLLLDTPAAQGAPGRPVFAAPGAGQTGHFKVASPNIDAMQALSSRWIFEGQASGRSVYLSARASYRFDTLDGFATGHGLAGCGENLWATDALYPTTGAVPSPSCWAYPTAASAFYDFKGDASNAQGQGVTIWLDGHAGVLGRTAANPGVTCRDIFLTEPGLSGLYWIDPTGGSPLQAWCGMADGRTLVAVKHTSQDVDGAAGINAVAWPTMVASTDPGRIDHFKLPTATIDVLQGLTAHWLIEGEVSGRTVVMSTTRATQPGYDSPNTYANLGTMHVGRSLAGCGADVWGSDPSVVGGAIPSPSCWAYPTRTAFYDFNPNASNGNGQGARIWLR